MYDNKSRNRDPLPALFYRCPDDDSDGDLVTDYLNNSSDKAGQEQKQQQDNTTASPSNSTTPRSSRGSIHLYTNNNNINTNNNNNNNTINSNARIIPNNNMVPIISVTPHSPGTKFSGILGKMILERTFAFGTFC